MLVAAARRMSLRRSTRVPSSSAPVATYVPTKAAAPSKKRTAEASIDAAAAKKSKTGKIDSASPPNTAAPEFKKPEAPATPLRKRRAAASKDRTEPPPLTPTPSLVNVLRAPYSSGDIDDATPPPEDRPVEPHVTNATLVTPGGTQKVAYGRGIPDPSPSKTGLPRPSATSGNLLDQACAHLIKVDPRMKPVIEKHHCSIFSAKGLAEEIDPFRSLVSGIMGQQVSGAAAKAIKNKFVALFNEGNEGLQVFPTASQVAATELSRLRLAGLSGRKAEYIQGLAEKFRDGELSTDMLMKATDEEVMEKLIAVRGLGKWSVEMFACFGLKRMDILSTGDLGVQRGMAAFFGKDVKKLKAKGGGKWKYMSEQDMLDKSAPFTPYRSLFMWYMWRVEDVDVDVMQNGN